MKLLTILRVKTALAVVLASTTTSGVTVGGGKLFHFAAHATRHDTRVNVTLTKECVTKPIRLIGCEVTPSGDVQHCAKVVLVYRPGCGILEVTHGKN